MSRNPWGSDSYDYNPDYNHLNEQYDQNSQYGQYGQGSYGRYGQVRMAKVRTVGTGRALTISIPMTRTAKTYMVRISTTRTVTSMTSP